MAVNSSIAQPGDAVCIAPQAEHLPQELRDRARWLVHRDGKPYAAKDTRDRGGTLIPAGSAPINAYDPANLVSFEQAWAFYLAGGFDGVGFSLQPEDGYVFVDIDHCLRSDGVVPGVVQFWLNRLATWTERSPGDDGVHAILRGRLPRPGCRYQLPDQTSSAVFTVEVYDHDRYVRLTGAPLAGITAAPISDRQAELDAFITFMAPSAGKAHSNGHTAPPEPGWQPTQISPLMDDDAILARARTHPRCGARFTSLYDQARWDEPASAPHYARVHDDGDGDRSAMDWWVAGELAYWTQDPAQIAHLMRRSVLARPKYDAVHYTRHPLYPPGSRVPYLEGIIMLRLYHKQRHYGDQGATTPEPEPPDPASAQERLQRRAQVYEELCDNQELSNSTRLVLVDLIRKAHLDIGEPIPATAHIGFIPAELRTAGVSASSFKAAVATLKRLGILSAVRRTPLKQSGHPWDDLSLHGAPLNGHWRTVGQQPGGDPDQPAQTPPAPGSRATLQRENKELRAALAERDRQLAERDRENAQLRIELLHYRACDYCGSLLTSRERACAACQIHLPAASPAPV